MSRKKASKIKFDAIWVFNGNSARFIGIDPGQTGGIVGLMASGEMVACPFDRQVPRVIFDSMCLNDGHTSVALEKVSAMPGQGVTSMFTFGEGYGRIQGYLEALRVGYNLVRPQAWQKILPPGGNPKDRVLAYCAETWGLDIFMASPRCRKPHQGMMDAACMAAYLREKHREECNTPPGTVVG